MPIRVVRLLEYIFEDQETADISMASWEVPAMGQRSFGPNMKVRSTVMFPHGDDQSMFTIAPEEESPATTFYILADSAREAVSFAAERGLKGYIKPVLPHSSLIAFPASPARAIQLGSTLSRGVWGRQVSHFHMAGIEVEQEADL